MTDKPSPPAEEPCMKDDPARHLPCDWQKQLDEAGRHEAAAHLDPPYKPPAAQGEERTYDVELYRNGKKLKYAMLKSAKVGVYDPRTKTPLTVILEVVLNDSD
jgi:hypothetical protein